MSFDPDPTKQAQEIMILRKSKKTTPRTIKMQQNHNKISSDSKIFRTRFR